MISGATMVQVSLGEIAAGFALLVSILWVFLRVMAWQWRRELDLRFDAEKTARTERQEETDRRFVRLDEHLRDEPAQWRMIHARIDEMVSDVGEIKGAVTPINERLGLMEEYLLQGKK